MTVPLFIAFAFVAVPFALLAALVWWWPREWAVDLLDEHSAALAGIDAVVAEDRDRLEAVIESLQPRWGLAAPLEQRHWDSSSVFAAVAATRAVPVAAVPDTVDAVIGRAWLRSGALWWLWAGTTAVRLTVSEPRLASSPRELRVAVLAAAAQLAADHAARLRLVGLAA